VLDVAIRGISSPWDEAVTSGTDHVVLERTLDKFCARAKALNELPVSVQHIVGGRHLV